MELTTLASLEEALGRPITPEEETQAGYIIKLISQYVVSYTGVSFEVKEDFVLRVKSDYYGRVQLPGGMVHSVDSVQYVQNPSWTLTARDFTWDGMTEIFNLYPNAVVDVVYTFGFDEIPDEIALVATEAARRLFDSPAGAGEIVGQLSRYKVGDIEEAFKGSQGLQELAGGLFNDMDKLILDDYRVTETTYAVGFTQTDMSRMSGPVFVTGPIGGGPDDE